mmetsp:Transcript_50518/g.80453  ORF Transcript_50518/g.80453 Transcript_50518/m.80453 type:complete len:114 (+) Transcript_50518:962-1303(+)
MNGVPQIAVYGTVGALLDFVDVDLEEVVDPINQDVFTHEICLIHHSETRHAAHYLSTMNGGKRFKLLLTTKNTEAKAVCSDYNLSDTAMYKRNEIQSARIANFAKQQAMRRES